MTRQDARERAWEMFRETYPNLTWSEFATAYDEGHADGRREDEQHIAALVAGIESLLAFQELVDSGQSVFPYDPTHPDSAGNTYDRILANLRALAGSKE